MFRCMQKVRSHQMAIKFSTSPPELPFYGFGKRTSGNNKRKPARNGVQQYWDYRAEYYNSASGWGWLSTGHPTWTTPFWAERSKCDPPTYLQPHCCGRAARPVCTGQTGGSDLAPHYCYNAGVLGKRRNEFKYGVEERVIPVNRSRGIQNMK